MKCLSEFVGTFFFWGFYEMVCSRDGLQTVRTKPSVLQSNETL